MHQKRIQTAALAACFVFVAGGCGSSGSKSEPPPLQVPNLEYGTRHFAGSALSGPDPDRPEPEATAPADAFGVRCRMRYYETLPDLDLPPLGTEARMIGTMRGEDAILASAVFTTNLHYADAQATPKVLTQLQDRAGARSTQLHEFDGALFPGTCVVFSAVSADTVDLAIDPNAQRRVGLLVSRGADDRIDVAFVIDQLAKPGEDVMEPVDAAEAGRDFDPFRDETGGRVLQREFVLLETPPQLDGGPALIVVPSPFEDDEHGGFATTIDVVGAPADGPDAEIHANAVAACLDEIRQENAMALEASRRLAAHELDSRQIAEALRNLQIDRVQRRTLVFLTSSTGALLAEDLALILEEAALGAYANAIVEYSESEGGALEAADGLGWVLERGAFSYLIEKLSDETIRPSEHGLLLKYTGEVGNFPAVLEDALLASKNRDEFLQRVADENRFFLEDHNVSARVRAFDWLSARDTVPAGYDPLGDVDARRAAIAEDRQRREAATDDSSNGAGARP